MIEEDAAVKLAAELVRGRVRARRRASALVLGCAGMVRIATDLQRQLGVPVVEPMAAGIRDATAGVNRGTGLGARAAR